MPMPLIVDDRGTVWPAHSPDLMKRHGDARRRVDDLVHELGFLRIDTFRSSQVVTFRPARTSPAGVIGTYYTVMEFLPKRIALRFFVGDQTGDTPSAPGVWRQEIHGDIHLALRRIEDLISSPAETRAGK
jgi:hypothetical protein